MTDAERIALRKWSAEDLLGFTEYHVDTGGIPHCKDREERWISWAPDLPESPAWQILAVIEAMSKKGLFLTMHSFISQGDIAFQAEFNPLGTMCQFNIVEWDFLEAVLTAAKAAPPVSPAI